MNTAATVQLRRFGALILASWLALALGACATQPEPQPEPEPVQQPAPEPKPEPPAPTYDVELDYPDGTVTFTSSCDYTGYVSKLRDVHSSDQNVHAVLKYVEKQSFNCPERINALEDYLRNLGALD